jgi:hypothetical protein
VKDHARHSTDQKQCSTSDTIDERQNATCGHQEDDVLDCGGVEVGVSSLYPSSQLCLSSHIGMLRVEYPDSNRKAGMLTRPAIVNTNTTC